jgi:hypothetical protein
MGISRTHSRMIVTSLKEMIVTYDRKSTYTKLRSGTIYITLILQSSDTKQKSVVQFLPLQKWYIRINREAAQILPGDIKQ